MTPRSSTRPAVPFALVALAALSATSPATASEPLEVPGFHPAEVVAADLSTPGPRPVVVVLHGNFDRPEWECATWGPLVGGRAFVLCPRGIPRRDAPGLDRWEYGGRPSILREVAAGRAALAARYPGRVDAGPDVWVGFSLGAIHLSPLARGAPSRYPRIVLVEGGLEGWDRRAIARWVRAGGRKIGFACGREGCRRQAERLGAALDAVGGGGRVAFAPIGHAFYGPLLAPTQAVLDWLVEDDPRFGRARR